MKLKIDYNSPVILTFTLVATAVMIVDTIIPGFTRNFFAFPPTFAFGNPLDYFRLVSHIAGHANWQHLAGNFAIILLIGPILEEKHGSKGLLVMMIVTALISSVFAILLFDHYGLGASGVVFMMIILSSFVNLKKGTIPLTFILVALLFLGQEVFNSLKADNVSQFAHILGGVSGAGFGFLASGRRDRSAAKKVSKSSELPPPS